MNLGDSKLSSSQATDSASFEQSERWKKCEHSIFHLSSLHQLLYSDLSNPDPI